MVEAETKGVWAEWWRLGGGWGHEDRMRVEEEEVEVGAAGRWWR